MAELELTESVHGSDVVLAPRGDIDLSRSPDLRSSLRRIQDSRAPKRLIVDLSGVSYMDSSGVATLVEALQTARKRNSQVILCGLEPRVRSIFEIARLDTVFTITGSVKDALGG